MSDILKDVSLNIYRYYLAETTYDSINEIKNKETKFGEILDKVAKESGKVSEKQPEIFRVEGKNRLIDLQDWTEETTKELTEKTAENHDVVKRKFISRSILDIFYIQTAISQKSRTSLNELSKVIKTLPNFEAEEDEELSIPIKSICVFLELTDNSSDNLEKIFSESLKGALGVTYAPSCKIDLGYAKVSIAENTDSPTWVIAVTCGEGNLEKAGDLADRVLPQYFLAYAKVTREYGEARKDIEKAKITRRKLKNYLDDNNLGEKSPSLLKMEMISEDLSTHRTNLAVEVSEAKTHLHTIEINIGNVEKLLENSLLSDKKNELIALMVNPLRLKREQIEAELSYLKIYLTKGVLINEKLKDVTQIRLAKWGRKATLFFGLLSAIGILQLFPKEFADNGNLDFVFSWESFFYKPFWVKFVMIMSLILFFLIVAFREEVFGLLTKTNQTETDNQSSSITKTKSLTSGTQNNIAHDDQKEKRKTTKKTNRN